MVDNSSELDDCISDVLKKFQLVSGLQFKLRQEQVIAVKTLLSNRDVFAVLPTGYGKSLIFQCFASFPWPHAPLTLAFQRGQHTATSCKTKGLLKADNCSGSQPFKTESVLQ